MVVRRVLADLEPRELAEALRKGELYLVTGAFTIRVTTCVTFLAERLREMYGSYQLAEPGCIHDLSIRVEAPRLRSHSRLSESR